MITVLRLIDYVNLVSFAYPGAKVEDPPVEPDEALEPFQQEEVERLRMIMEDFEDFGSYCNYLILLETMRIPGKGMKRIEEDSILFKFHLFRSMQMYDFAF